LKRGTGFSALGLVVWILAFSPFLTSILMSKSTARRCFWIIPRLVSDFFVWVFRLDPAGHHDCDRKGMSIAVTVLPMIVLAINTVLAACAAFTIWLFGKSLSR
jgi:hypothetical protein